MRIIVDSAAYRDAAEAAAWYDGQTTGMGDRLLNAVAQAIDAIADAPWNGSRYELISDESVRCVRLRKFPYIVVYEIGDDAVRILAVAHERRRPGYWMDRP